VLERRAFIVATAAAAVAGVVAACSSNRTRAAPTSSPSVGSTPPSNAEQPSTSAPSSTAPTAPNAPSFVSTGPRDRQQVALTFHVSGDAGLVTNLLDLLRARHVPITAFMVGNWLEANPDVGKRFVDDGHEIANHTYTHLTFASLDHATMTSEVDRCRDVIQRVAGTGGRFFRPSGTANGIDTPAQAVLDVARGAGYQTVIGYDVDPADYQDPGAAAVSQRTLAAVQPGSIVSLHFGHQGTIDALPSILTGLQARGLTPVTTSALLA
jgi:peptidoglycan/xylan/chitin deacetylase (PgdA/CDA1 family)